jgi:hypothetical protein
MTVGEGISLMIAWTKSSVTPIETAGQRRPEIRCLTGGVGRPGQPVSAPTCLDAHDCHASVIVGRYNRAPRLR